MGARSFRRPLAVGLCASALLAPTWSCLDATAIDLRIETDEPVANIAAPQQAQILVGTPADVLTTPSTSIPSNPVDASGSFGDLVVAPNDDIGAAVAMRVVLGVTVPTDQCDASPQGCIVASRTIRYLPHHELVLNVTLESKCLGVTCPSAQTCVAGTCVDDTVDTGLCDGGVCGPGSLGDGSTADSGPVDASSACDVASPATCGSNTCVDLASDPANCGACGIDCTGGTCVNGTCQLGTMSKPSCLGLWNGSVYVRTLDGALHTVPTKGGAVTDVTPAGGTVVDVATLGEGQDFADAYAGGAGWRIDEKLTATTTSTSYALDRIGLDAGGFAWFSLSTGQVGHGAFGGTPMSYASLGSGAYTAAWVASARGGADIYTSVDVTTLYHATSSGIAAYKNAVSSPPLITPSGVAVDDPTTLAPIVYVVENRTAVVSFDAALTTKTLVADGGVGMSGLAWDKETSTAYAVSDGAIFRSDSTKKTMTVVAPAPNAAPRCVVVDGQAVYWVATTGGVFKHAK